MTGLFLWGATRSIPPCLIRPPTGSPSCTTSPTGPTRSRFIAFGPSTCASQSSGRAPFHAGKVLMHRQLLKEVWGPNAIEHTHQVRVYMTQLRHKPERDATRAGYLLVTEPGVGYRLKVEGGRPPGRRPRGRRVVSSVVSLPLLFRPTSTPCYDTHARTPRGCYISS